MKAVILCGGFGTRLGTLTKDTPKPLLQVAGVPFLHHVLRSLAHQGITDVVLAVGFQWRKIAATYGTHWENLHLTYSIEETPLGTGGAIRQAVQNIGNSPILVINGDTLFCMDFRHLQKFHIDRQAQISIAVRAVPDVSRYGAVVLEDPQGRICQFKEKSHTGAGLINTGVYIINPSIFQKIPEETFSFEKTILSHHLQSLKAYAYETSGHFIDIGIPADLAIADAWLSKDNKHATDNNFKTM
jgi:D-glycero-alpha-D-manno-heptose 1-phosphate guanylyltransferase